MAGGFWRCVLVPTKSHALSSVGLLILRVGIGGMMLIGHGWGKLTTYSENLHTWGDPIGLGPEVSLTLMVFAEAFCAFAIVLGVLTRWAAIPLVFGMGVAAFVAHGADPFFMSGGRAKEPALLYLVPFLTLVFTGAGRYSIDSMIAKALEKPQPYEGT